MIQWTFRGAWTALFVLLISFSYAHSQQAGDAAPAQPPQVDKAAQKAEAQKILDDSFGPAIKEAKATRDTKDDLALAQRLLELTPTYSAQPVIQGLLCENAYQLAQKDPGGIDTAAKAMTLLAQTLPDEAPAALANIVALRRKAFGAAKREEKSHAAKQLINALVWQGEHELARKNADAALVAYRAALPMAATYHPKDRDALNEIIKRATAQAQIEKQIIALKAKIQADAPDRDAAALELLMIYIVDFDDPKAAAEYAYVSNDKALTQRIKLATGPTDMMPPDQARALGDWYLDLAEKTKNPATRPAMIARAKGWYELFLDHYTQQDLTRTKVKLQVDKLTEDLKKMGFANLAAKGLSPRNLEIEVGVGVQLKLVRINPGEFLMGSPENETGRNPDELQHKVKIDKPFYMGVYEVNQGQYRAIMGRNPSHFKGDDEMPAESMSWEDATAFCRKLSEKSGHKVRLPTEAEWEYACRAGTTTPYAFGSTISTDFANYNGNHVYGDGVAGVNRKMPVSVGSLKRANPWGLYDMHGNLWEWCNSKRMDYPYRADDGREEHGGTTARMMRGGCWYDRPFMCRSAFRLSRASDQRYHLTGFRVAVDINQ